MKSPEKIAQSITDKFYREQLGCALNGSPGYRVLRDYILQAIKAERKESERLRALLEKAIETVTNSRSLIRGDHSEWAAMVDRINQCHREALSSTHKPLPQERSLLDLVRNKVKVTCACGNEMFLIISGKTDDLYACTKCNPGQVNIDFAEYEAQMGGREGE